MKNYLLLFLLFSVIANAQYTTPNEGQAITLSDLLLVEPAIVILSDTDVYSLNADLIISVNDTLLIDQLITLKISPEILITVQGTLITSSPDPEIPVMITAQNIENPHKGFRLEEGSFTNLSHTVFEYGGGFKVLSTDFIMDNCEVKYQYGGASTSGSISFSRGAPEITNTYFYQNQLPAIATGANQTAAIKFIGNTLEYNSMSNGNRPQINISSSGANEYISIQNNTILGDRSFNMVGGIAVSNFFGNPNTVMIKNNIIKDNRYGLTLVGPVTYAEIDNNIISDNDTQGNPDLGGSGINLNSSGDEITQDIIIKNNYISNNLWGITMQGSSFANLGDGTENSPGGNTFSENGFNDIVYALYNNTPNDIMAQGNCWIEGQNSNDEEVAAVIVDQSDIASLGIVDYSNHGCNLSVNDLNLSSKVQLYPNPAKNVFHLDVTEKGNVEFYNSLGQLVLKSSLIAGKNNFKVDLNPGIYFIKIISSKNTIFKKLLIK